MNTVFLNGDWQLARGSDTSTVAALVPGCVHLDLLRGGQLEDPFYRDNEARQFWIGETDWTYSRTFSVSAELLSAEKVLLRCHGLDTLATVSVNGTVVGKADNMYRTWEFDVKAALKQGENSISIHFDAPMPFLRKTDAEKGELPAWVTGMRLHGASWLRKEPCNFGWDWGPKLVTSGIWRDIEIIAYNARLTDVAIRQQHSAGKVDLNVAIGVENLKESALTARVEVTQDGTSVASADVPVSGAGAQASLTIDNPKLWWVNGMGEQPLYDVTVTLLGTDGQPIDQQSKRIGLRTLELDRHADTWGESFQFSINGQPFFAKGANWIPADTFVPRITREHYESQVRDAAAANMNILRVWGGGIYEQDEFYDLCDEYGVAIWQDFMFACGTYPAFDADFMANVRAEAEDNVRRMRHHPSIALWCGNNEMEQGLVADEWTERTMSWADYDKLFNALLPEVTGTLDPDRAYWPCSPHTSVGDRVNWRSEESGDTHLWEVWHGRQPFEWYRTRFDRFCSEFGFQSFPEPASIEPYIQPEDHNITSYMMEYRQRSGIGNSTIIHYLLDWFRLPTSFENGIWLSQILQGMAIKYAVEHWRRQMPRTMGTIYWQLNDCWPGPSWSSIDSLGRWKALHYMAKRFYQPLMISGLEDMKAGTVEIHITSDLPTETKGVVRWTLTTANGELLHTGEDPVTAAPYADTLGLKLELAEQIPSNRDVLLWLELTIGTEVVSDNLVLFARPKHLNLHDPHIHATLSDAGEGKVIVQLTAEHPALWVWLSTRDGNLKYSDNFVHLAPGVAKTIEVTGAEGANELLERLQIQSLLDTYQQPEMMLR